MDDDSGLFTNLLLVIMQSVFVTSEYSEFSVTRCGTVLKRNFGVKSILDYSVESDLSTEQAVQKTKSSKLAAEIAPAAIKNRIDEKTLQGTQKQYAVHEEFADRRKDVVSASIQYGFTDLQYGEAEFNKTYLYEGEETCDRNRDIFMETVDAVAKVTQGEGFAAIKVTALGRPTLLLKLVRYNREQGNIFNTYQAYLRNALDCLECDMQLARREGWHFGLKLVRGAYIEQERKRAATIGYPDPINPDIE
ncbi:hypothetical protein OSTOST_11022, partial [Ostertagia ostertagi]